MTRHRRRGAPELADLYLVGTGIRGLQHLTEEARDVLSRCRIVLDGSEQHESVRKLNPNSVDLEPLYWTGDEREVVYERLIRTAMDEVARGPGVAMVTYGHPLLFDDINNRLRRMCRSRGLECVVLPGISCLDTLSVDLGIDYGDGLQVYDATDLVVNEYPLNPRAHTLLLQLGEYEFSRTSDALELQPGRLRSLVKYLRRTYERDHRAVICYSDDGSHGELLKTRLHRLDSHWRRIFPGTTLYLPPTES